ncbi:MAG: pentapeptide repeat-containing protein, partial [Nitrospinaceae bacterium]
MTKITAERLRKMDACEAGIELFEERYPKGLALGDWTREEQLAVIQSPLRAHWMWAVKARILPLWSMARADLSGADLSDANLDEANLSGADLSGADLSKASLSFTH